MDNIPKKDRYIAARLHSIFLFSRLITIKNMGIILDRLPIFLYQNTIISSFANTAIALIIARPLITLIICSQIHQRDHSAYLATRDIMNSVLNQFIISSLILFIYLINCGMIGDPLSKSQEVRREMDHIWNIAETAFYYFAIDSIIAIIFTLSGKQFKNPLIIRLVR